MHITSLQVGPIMTNCYLLCDEAAKVCALIDPGDDAPQVERTSMKRTPRTRSAASCCSARWGRRTSGFIRRATPCRWAD